MLTGALTTLMFTSTPRGTRTLRMVGCMRESLPQLNQLPFFSSPSTRMSTSRSSPSISSGRAPLPSSPDTWI